MYKDNIFDFNEGLEIIHKNCGKRIEECKCKDPDVIIVKKQLKKDNRSGEYDPAKQYTESDVICLKSV